MAPAAKLTKAAANPEPDVAKLAPTPEPHGAMRRANIIGSLLEPLSWELFQPALGLSGIAYWILPTPTR